MTIHGPTRSPRTPSRCTATDAMYCQYRSGRLGQHPLDVRPEQGGDRGGGHACGAGGERRVADRQAHEALGQQSGVGRGDLRPAGEDDRAETLGRASTTGSPWVVISGSRLSAPSPASSVRTSGSSAAAVRNTLERRRAAPWPDRRGARARPARRRRGSGRSRAARTPARTPRASRTPCRGSGG